ncbi:MAG: DNA repair exonuclease [Nanoarchaeota archaeon]
MKFAHMADCHLDGWRLPELNALNMQSFQRAVTICIKERVEFVLIAGDLFDSAYPSIDSLKETFREFRRLKEANIPVFIISGSHDYSVSGKTFLDVLEKSGFCTNVINYENKGDTILLQPTIYKNVAIYGYPGKKSGLEIEELERVKIEDAPGLFKILMLHTTIRGAVQNPKIKSVDESKLPKVNYVALGHLHISYNKNGMVYPGPLFPNNLQELEELKNGSFFIFENGNIERKEVKLREILVVNYSINNALYATEGILKLLERESLKDKVVIVKLEGLIEQGRTSDIDFVKIENYVKKREALIFLKSMSKLLISESKLEFDTINTEDIEVQILKNFMTLDNKFSHLILPLTKSLQIEKIDEERSGVFEERVLSEVKKMVGI